MLHAARHVCCVYRSTTSGIETVARGGGMMGWRGFEKEYVGWMWRVEYGSIVGLCVEEVSTVGVHVGVD